MKDLKAGDEIEIREKKTSKSRRITLNKACVKAIQSLLDSKEYRDGGYLFQSQKKACVDRAIGA